MNTRTPQIIVLALLAALPALRVLAQQPAAPAAAEPAATPTTEAAAAPAPAAPVEAAAPAAPAAPAAAAETAAAPAATRSRDAAGRDTLSVDFPDEDIRNILRNVADLFELNIIMPDTLQGKTTIKLRDVTWRQIFQSVLQPVNYTYVEEGNIIKIVSNESLLQEPTSTDVFMINYARASDILPTITSLVDPAAGGKIVVDARSNSLVITERPSRMNRIRPIIEQLDRATDQVMIESKFVEVSDTDVKNIGVNWSSLAGYQVGVGGIRNEYLRGRESLGQGGFNNTNTNTQGSTSDVQNTTGSTRNSTQGNGSTTSSTVTSSGGVTTTTSSTGTTGQLGNTSSQTSGTTSNTGSLNNITNTIENLNSLLNSGGTSRALSAVFSASDFNVVLSALQSLQKTKVVSNPTIVTLNNTQAVINVGQERPIPNYTYNSERGVYEVSGFTYRPIGVILKVTPQVNSRGFIKLTVEPEVSQSNRDANFNGAAIPIVESRKANTTVSLRDGFTMGIGGLVQSQANNGSNKVPVLGSIPVVGRLFKSESRNSESTNLIIFITAKTISAEGATVEQVFDSERVRGLDLRREDLPGYRDGSNPFISSLPKTTAAQP
jgi:type II secretory pathway component GspD/PulD (secretin)